MKNKVLVIVFKSGAWQKVICKDVFMDVKSDGTLINIDFEECENGIVPLFINPNEISAIFPYISKTNYGR